jgi:hypothetical protein
MDPDIHLWDGNNKWYVGGKEFMLYKALCGDLVPWSNVACYKQPTCTGCILLKFQYQAEQAERTKDVVVQSVNPAESLSKPLDPLDDPV